MSNSDLNFGDDDLDNQTIVTKHFSTFYKLGCLQYLAGEGLVTAKEFYNSEFGEAYATLRKEENDEAVKLNLPRYVPRFPYSLQPHTATQRRAMFTKDR